MSMTSNGAASTSDVPFSLDAVWRILPAVYDSLAVPITVLDPAKHLIGNESYKLRRQLGKVSLSRYIDCGDTQIGPSADSYDIVLTVLTQITAGPSGNTHIATSVEAQGKPITHSQEYSRCTSKGLLETRVAEIVNARLQK